jgi:hypothetical protein
MHPYSADEIRGRSWAMILIGFAGLGFAFRRSRCKAAFA